MDQKWDEDLKYSFIFKVKSLHLLQLKDDCDFLSPTTQYIWDFFTLEYSKIYKTLYIQSQLLVTLL